MLAYALGVGICIRCVYVMPTHTCAYENTCASCTKMCTRYTKIYTSCTAHVLHTCCTRTSIARSYPCKKFGKHLHSARQRPRPSRDDAGMISQELAFLSLLIVHVTMYLRSLPPGIVLIAQYSSMCTENVVS